MKPTYQWTRFLILRLLGFTYLFAFLSAALQLPALVGEHGLTPMGRSLDLAAMRYGSRLDAFLHFPSIFFLWFSDGALAGFAWLGVVLSLVVLAGWANAFVMGLLWALYLSIVHVGGEWYGYGWEIQTVETGFLAIFLCPLLDGRPFPKREPPVVIIFLFRWLIVRIMLGAGLIKLRGDPCWRDLTCLVYHYETQPIPNPLSPLFHFMPRWVHQGGVLFNHLVELVAPLLAFGPRRARQLAGVLFVLFQLTLILSGNLAFLNWLTLVPALACFDDGFFRRHPEVEAPTDAARITSYGVAVLVAVLSIQPVVNLFSDHQLMNSSFMPLHLVNTYGAFGSVGKERDEIILEGTDAEVVDDSTVWKAYEIPCKPGAVDRRPCWISPYQPRIAWQIWFAAMSNPSEHDWLVHLIAMLLDGDPVAKSLLERDPFPDHPPKKIRALLYHYRFAPLGADDWWVREPAGEWLVPLEKDDPRLSAFLEAHGYRE